MARTVAEAMGLNPEELEQPRAPGDEADVEPPPEGAPQEEPSLEEQELRAQQEREAKEARLIKLDALGLVLAKSRSEAISGRMVSGVELEWEEDEEHYEGIDDANRHESTSWRSKPAGQISVSVDDGQTTTTSTVFPNITRPYVDTGSARMSDMLLPTDDRAWAIKPTPVPELGDIAKGKYPKQIIQQVVQMHPGDPAGAQDELALATRAALEVLGEAKDKAERAQLRIEDWHVECQFHSQVRKVIESAALRGVGVLKGPTPGKRRTLVMKGGKLIVDLKIKPGSRSISPWNFYPDPACGENIHNGQYTWERDDLTAKMLEALIGTPGYVTEQINKCIAEGPGRATKEAPDKPEPDGRTVDKTKLFEIWYFHGYLTWEDLVACGEDVEDTETARAKLVPAQITMVNNRVIKGIMNPLDTGEFPYDVMPWQVRSGHWAGIGISRQVRTPQRMVVAATRNMMDNAGRAGGPQLVLLQGKVVPQDGEYTVTPWKVWLAAEDSDLDHLDNAFRFVTIPIMQKELQEIINFGLKMAEDTTGMPLLIQGQQGKAPDTLGGMQLLNNNASTVLRRTARLFDDYITEPHVRRYYAYLMQYGEDDSEKGDFQIDARGSSALVERDIQNQAVLQVGSFVKDPAFGIDPKKWFAEWCKSQRLDVRRFQYTPEEQERIDQMASEGPVDPRIAVAQMRNQLETQLTQFVTNFEAKESAKNRDHELMLKAIDSELDRMAMGGKEHISLAGIKSMLAAKVIDIRSKTSLFDKERALKLRAGSGI